MEIHFSPKKKKDPREYQGDPQLVSIASAIPVTRLWGGGWDGPGWGGGRRSCSWENSRLGLGPRFHWRDKPFQHENKM